MDMIALLLQLERQVNAYLESPDGEARSLNSCALLGTVASLKATLRKITGPTDRALVMGGIRHVIADPRQMKFAI
jgi:hypothetical protein